jgi:hypothetical protein
MPAKAERSAFEIPASSHTAHRQARRPLTTSRTLNSVAIVVFFGYLLSCCFVYLSSGCWPVFFIGSWLPIS